MRWLAPAMLGAGLFAFAFYAPRARSAEPPRWQVVECKPVDGVGPAIPFSLLSNATIVGFDCRPRGKALSSETACFLDVWSYGNAAEVGTRYRCERVPR